MSVVCSLFGTRRDKLMIWDANVDDPVFEAAMPELAERLGMGLTDVVLSPGWCAPGGHLTFLASKRRRRRRGERAPVTGEPYPGWSSPRRW